MKALPSCLSLDNNVKGCPFSLTKVPILSAVSAVNPFSSTYSMEVSINHITKHRKSWDYKKIAS
jgi:hypothetical protein